MSLPKYADIIIPVALEGRFTYEMGDIDPATLEVGSRVIVNFGKSRHIIGVIERLHSDKPSYPGIKRILGIPEFAPNISRLQLNFWNWISEYYMCTTGEVMDAALPSGLKLKNSGDSDTGQRYKPKLSAYIKLSRSFSEGEMIDILDKMDRAPSVKKLLTRFLEITSFGEKDFHKEISKEKLLEGSGISPATLRSLVKKNIFMIEHRETDTILSDSFNLKSPLPLSKDQELSLNQINSGFKKSDTVLLKGVTSSGKTEIYIHLIVDQIKKGKQVLYLLPEIALTSQLINRLRCYFGNRIGIYHSRFTDNERVDVWRKTAAGIDNGNYDVILGVRSSLFLPFDNLGLIIVDEEHDNSYKQKDPAPRYNARDGAIVLAGLHRAKVLLGSATPSVESVFNCNSGKYVLVELNSRYGDVKMPEIEIADTREAYRRKIMISHFTPQLIKATEEALERGEQAVFFRNRRGYAPLIVCAECTWTPVCTDCSVNMTYHKGINKLKCHYCGKADDVPRKCPNCNSTDLSMKGFGTEKIEDELSILFPAAKVHRMDLDTTRRKGSLDKIISMLEKGSIDILVGTQMISKGLDFENLTMVGVLNVDNMLLFPDFRAGEKCFQLIEQVSGRAGRREKQGKVVLQTSDPTHSIIRQSINHDFWGMYNSQIVERKEFGYPPYTRLIKLFIRHRERSEVIKAAGRLGTSLRSTSEMKVLGPEFPIISRIQNWYHMTILLKIDRENRDLGRIKQFIKLTIKHTLKEIKNSGLRIYADVDPM